MTIFVGILIGVVGTVVGGGILTLLVWLARTRVLPVIERRSLDGRAPVELEIGDLYMKVHLHSKRMIHQLTIYKNGMDVLVNQTYLPGQEVPTLGFTLEPNDVISVHWSIVNSKRTAFIDHVCTLRPKEQGRYRCEPDVRR